MKKFILFLFFLFTLIITNVTAQEYSVNIRVFDGLSNIDFAAFGLTNDLSGTPRILCVDVLPTDKEIIAKGSIEWKKVGAGSYVELINFETETFTSNTFCNNDLGINIRIKETNSNSDALTDNLKLGKPTGEYIINLSIYNPEGEFLASDSEEISFINPTQTFRITSPNSGSDWDVGSVVVNWEQVEASLDGPATYRVIGNVRGANSGSLEDALSQGNLIIDGEVGSELTVNLLDPRIQKRELIPGKEMVIQVVATVPGPDGGTKLRSEIVNFNLISISQTASDQAKEILNEIGVQLAGDIEEDFLEVLNNASLSIQSIVGDDGKPLTEAEVQALLNYIYSNLDKVVNITKID